MIKPCGLVISKLTHTIISLYKLKIMLCCVSLSVQAYSCKLVQSCAPSHPSLSSSLSAPCLVSLNKAYLVR